jgi:IS605 OrfB family transposase
MPSALVQSIRDLALGSVKALKFKFKPHKSVKSAITFDVRTLRLRGRQLTFSSRKGRIKTLVSFPSWCQDIVSNQNWKLKAGQLCFNRKKNKFFINLNFDCNTPLLKDVGDVVGLDRGLVNLVVTSRGEIFNSKKIRASQRKHLYLRKILSAKSTRSSKRLLKKLSGKEKRFSREQNHILTKALSQDRTVRVYVLEDLKGIRNKKKGKKMNKLLSSWPFFQFEQFLRYKCEAQGISVDHVDARYTSQKCSVCGVVRKENRVKGKYVCSSCGHRDHADINAAKNIRDRWVLNQSSRRQNVEQGAVNHPSVPTAEPRASALCCA